MTSQREGPSHAGYVYLFGSNAPLMLVKCSNIALYAIYFYLLLETGSVAVGLFHKGRGIHGKKGHACYLRAGKPHFKL